MTRNGTSTGTHEAYTILLIKTQPDSSLEQELMESESRVAPPPPHRAMQHLHLPSALLCTFFGQDRSLRSLKKCRDGVNQRNVRALAGLAPSRACKFLEGMILATAAESKALQGWYTQHSAPFGSAPCYRGQHGIQQVGLSAARPSEKFYTPMVLRLKSGRGCFCHFLQTTLRLLEP